MIKARRRPSGRGMANSTVRAKRREDVNWIGGSFEIGLMTGQAGHGGIGIALLMTSGTSESLMRASQREIRKNMVELRGTPTVN